MGKHSFANTRSEVFNEDEQIKLISEIPAPSPRIITRNFGQIDNDRQVLFDTQQGSSAPLSESVSKQMLQQTHLNTGATNAPLPHRQGLLQTVNESAIHSATDSSSKEISLVVASTAEQNTENSTTEHISTV